MAKGRGGRPPLPPEARRTEVLKVRLTPAESDMIWRRALHERTSASGLLRDLGLRGPKTTT